MPPTPLPAARTRHAVAWGPLTLAGVLIVFAVGVVWLFALRFDVGDVYPLYSTLRSDPLGAKAFFASLEDLPGLRVERSLQLLASLGVPPLSPAGADHGEKGFTCFCLGLDANQWPNLFDPEAVARLETIMARGGRVVLTFQPARTPPTVESLSNARDAHSGSDKVGLHQGSAKRRHAKEAAMPDLITRWGVDFRRQRAHNEPADDGKKPAPRDTPPKEVKGIAMSTMPDDTEAVLWRSALDFRPGTLLAVRTGWRELYNRRGRPVVVARPFGTAGGELLLVSDTYPLSNEGLRNDPAPTLLAGLVGGGRRVLFDESHLGVSEQPGLAALARRYRLQGALLAVGVLVGLFVWRNVVSLVPARASSGDDAGGADLVAGHAAGHGYLNLLRRGVPARDLLAVCLAQWEQTSHPAGSLERVRAVLEAEKALPVRRRRSAAAIYRAMCEAARQKSRV